MNARIFILLASLAVHSSFAQGTFQNLGFENSTVPVGTPNGTLVPIPSAFPGWSAYFETAPVTQARYNDINLDTPGFSLLTTNSSLAGFTPFAGGYTAVLQGGSPIYSGAPTSVSLAQVGTVPTGTMSLHFLAWGNPNLFSASMGGQSIGLQVLQIFPTFYEFGADISPFAGQTVELRFTQAYSPGGIGNLALDNISFSPTAVPEPSTWALLALGAAAFCCAARRRRK